MSQAAAPVLYGKYQLLDLLARGGMAEVFKAKSHGVEGFEKILVIKRILPELSENPRFVEMFINEAKIAVTLSHANIVQVFDLGRADEMYFIAMEYVAGYDLATVLSRGRKLGRPLPQELAVYVVSELAKGLDYAHRRRDAQQRPLSIVHRDVSPQNVLVSFEGEVKLTDFGIAKAALAVEENTDEGVLKGKYAYMSPEQARGEDVDARTDLYALGVVLYELLSGGQNPFYDPRSTYETLRRVRDSDFQPLASRVPDLPEELSAIAARAMSRKPEDRHANAGELYEELVQFLYSSGRRVGGHDLADYLQEVRRASEMAAQAPDDARLRAVFDERTGSAPVYQPDATPVEVPVARTGPRRRASREPRRTTGNLQIPTLERRDVTALVLSSKEGHFLDGPVVKRLIDRLAGMAVDYEPPPGSESMRLVLFGVLDPDGRDTEAAARCALRLIRTARSGTQTGAADVNASIGIHGGRMLVDLDGKPVRDESFGTLSEKARELAERAASGQVLISDEGRRAIAGLFKTSPTTDVAGAPYIVEEERSLADASGKFVGRRDELRRIGELLAAANRGRMKVIGVTGEAGSGKTRLLLETKRRLQLGGHDVGMYVASCPRQNRRVPLSAMQELLRELLGLDELAAADELREKVARLRELGLGPGEMAAVTVTLGGEVEGAEAQENPAQMLRTALARMTLKLAEDRLTVLAWDGAENMDDESQLLLDGLIRDTREARVAIVLSYRPGFVHAWTDLPSYFELRIGPMDDDDVARLTGTRLAAEEVPIELLREVTTKSDGNPLYVEEYLKALADAGAIKVRGGRVDYDPLVAEVKVPKTLRGIVSSRLARLSQFDRNLLQVASIAGERFTGELLASVIGEEMQVVERTLEALEARGLVTRRNAEHDFSHDLIGEVLRDGLTLETRREFHAAIAEAHELLYPHRLDELAEKLAHHHREAGERGRAVDYLVRAADRLVGEHALGGAVAALERAIDLLSQMASPDRDRMIELYGRIGELGFRSRDLEGCARRLGAAVELCESLGRPADVARMSMLRGRLLVNLPGSSAEGRRWLDQARSLSAQLGDQRLLRDVVLATAEADMRRGEHGNAMTHFIEAITHSRQLNDIEAQIRCLVPLALATASDSREQDALAHLEEARNLQRQVGDDRFTECEMLKIESLVHFFGLDYGASLDAAGRALELAKEYGFSYEAAVNAHNMGEAYLRLGDYKRAFASLRYSYEMARNHGFQKLQWANMRVLGFIDATRFGSKEGRTHIAQANDYAEKHRFIWDLIQGRYYLAIVDQGRGDHELARAALREILRLAADHGHTDYVKAAEKALKALDAGSTIQLPW